MKASDWLVWQLADSAFPTGGFAHSCGLEASWQLGLVNHTTLPRFLAEALEHAAATALPLLGGVHDSPEDFEELDLLADAMLSNHVANRASRAQGAALANTASSTFDSAPLRQLRQRGRLERWPMHLAPVFGAVSRALGLGRDEACRLFVFQTLRTLTSSAVRLGCVGPLEAQALQWRLAKEADDIAIRHAAFPPEEAAQTHPLLELYQAQHDRLYSRLFSS